MKNKKDRFLAEYHGHRFEDQGGRCSKDFKSFAGKFKKYLVRTLPAGYEIEKHRCGHYFLSGFVRNGENTCYYSYTWNRMDPVDVNGMDLMHGAVLYRSAENSSDYRGGHNMYTSIENLPQAVAELLG